MGSHPKLDQKLLAKIADKNNKSLQYVREQIAKRADRLNIVPEAAQLIWAKQLGFGIASALRRLSPNDQDQVRLAFNTPATTSHVLPAPVTQFSTVRQQDEILSAMRLLILDTELLSRCGDLLRRRKHLDRVMREATVILEDRIRRLAGITSPLRPEELVNTAINPDPTKAILVFGTQPFEQQGLHSICRGIVLAFRHQAHHRLTDQLSREDALKFVGFIDILLSLLSTTVKNVPIP